MNTEYPLKKTFEQDFLTEDGANLFTLRYEQATMAEYHDFLSLGTDEQFLSVYSIIKQQIALLWWERIVFSIFNGYIPRSERWIDMEKVIVNVIANRFRTHKSIFEESKKWGKFLPSAGLAIVCQEYNLSPHELYNNYTLEQYTWMIDGIIYKGNEQTKEGQAKNKWALRDKEWAKKRAEETKKYFQ